MHYYFDVAEARTHQLIIALILIIVMAVGCAQDTSWSDQHQIVDALEKNGYSAVKKVNRTGPGASDPWAAICDKEEKEWLVIIQPDWKLSATELGIDGRLTIRQLVRKLDSMGYSNTEERLSLIKDNINGTFEHPEFCWSYPETENKFLKFDLYGNLIPEKQ
ncbi:MAG: hypothetical protein ACYCVD_14845 [Desulfitobacteriaceae bacterium]